MKKLIMVKDNIKTYRDIQTILENKENVSFKFSCTKDAYIWIESIFKQFYYSLATKKEKGLLIKYIQIMTNYSSRQIKRLANKYKQTGCLKMGDKKSKTSYRTKFTHADIELLALTDKLHNNINGLAIKNILEKEYAVHENVCFGRLSKISVAHIYNLRKTQKYLAKNLTYTKTKPNKKTNDIGVRQKPFPEGKPGFIRIDTVHQGDLGKAKGVYHIQAVDEETQWDIVFSVEKITEAYVVPALEEMLSQFPFEIKEFHSDNGSEYVNKRVAELLNRLLIKFTKSRARQSNDNALVESKNCSIIRKNIGYGYIDQKHAPEINAFYRQHFNIYLNYFRPCLFPKIRILKKGKEIKTYPYENTMTPFERLKSIPNYKSMLSPTFEFDKKEALVNTISPNDFAERMVKAKIKLFKDIK